MENKKELSVKQYFLYTLLALCGFAIWYIGAAFVILDLNIINWQENTRFLVFTNGLLTSIGIVAVTYINRNQQNY
jgi:hypothetical protein